MSRATIASSSTTRMVAAALCIGPPFAAEAQTEPGALVAFDLHLRAYLGGQDADEIQTQRVRLTEVDVGRQTHPVVLDGHQPAPGFLVLQHHPDGAGATVGESV